MPKYKGNNILLQDIPAGSPVQLLTSVKTSHGVTICAGSLGVMSRYDPITRTARFHNDSCGLAMCALNTPDYVLGRYTVPSGLPATTEMRILTGTRGQKLTKDLMNKVLLGNVRIAHSINTATSGCDPEIFVRRGNGEVFPAWEFLPDKFNGIRATVSGGHIEAYWDGFQAEFNNTAANCVSWMVDRVQLGLKTILQAARAKDPKATLTLDNVVNVTPQVLEEADWEHVNFGCKPSLNAYGVPGLKIDDPRLFPVRFAGGHIHLGADFLKHDPVKYVKAFDRIVGLATVSLFAGIDNPVRRQFYGRAGEYRLPAHGIEYRPLSNAWMCHPAIAFWVFDAIRGAMHIVKDGMTDIIPNVSDETIQAIINECDVKAARKLLKQYDALYRCMAKTHYETEASQQLISHLLSNGIGSVIDPRDVEGNWLLKDGWIRHGEAGTFKKFSNDWAENTLAPVVKARTARA